MFREEGQRGHLPLLGITHQISQEWQVNQTKLWTRQDWNYAKTFHSGLRCYSLFYFPLHESQCFQSDSTNGTHSVHMRWNNPIENTEGRGPFLFVFYLIFHTSIAGLNKSGLPRVDTGSPAGIICSWLEGTNLTGKSLQIFFLSPPCLKQVKTGPLDLLPCLLQLFMNPTWPISIPPLRLAFSLVYTWTRSSVSSLLREQQDTYCSDSTASTLFTCTCSPHNMNPI